MESTLVPDNGPVEVTSSLPEPAAEPDELCFGIKCNHHLDCQRYLALEGDSSNLPRIATCIEVEDGVVRYPRFLMKL